MSTHFGSNGDSKVSTDGDVDPSVIILNRFRERSKNEQDSAQNAKAVALNANHARKICFIAKLQPLFLPMKLFGLYIDDIRGYEGIPNRSRVSLFANRLYQCLVLLLFWLNFGKTLASFWVDKDQRHDDTLVLAMMLWFLQTALQGTICFFTMQITPKKSGLKSLMSYWNSQPNFDELVIEPYMIKCIKRTLLVTYFLVALNLLFNALIAFLPSESLQLLARALMSPLPIDSIAVKTLSFLVSLYCTAAWLMPLAMFTAVCLTLTHQCGRLRKAMRLTASADGLARVIILRRQHSSLCGSVRKADNLFKFLTLVVYVTNIPLVCFLLYYLIFIKYNDTTTVVILSFWFANVIVIMVGVSFLGATINNKVCELWAVL